MSESILMKGYIFYVPSYNENSGGVLAMHKLCHLLNETGHHAFLWKYDDDDSLTTNNCFNTPTIFKTDLDEFIVIYMDIIAGNPLNASHVVRWFLQKPGFFTQEVRYGENELYFYFQKSFNDPKINPNSDHQLYIAHIRDDIYKETNFGRRSGSCYIIRKGKGKKLVHDLTDSIPIDGLSHDEIAKIFNEKEYFYSYDLYTAYAFFAAMCGCIPVVIPDEHISVKEWFDDEYLRYGIAYGFDDVEYAYQTKHKIYDTLQILEEKAKEDVRKFIQKSQRFFDMNGKTQEIIDEEKLKYLKSLKSTSNKIVFFGVSESLRTNFYMLKYNGVVPDYFCDNSDIKQNEFFEGERVYNPEKLFNLNEKFDVLVTSSFHNEIKQQLLKYPSIEAIYSIYG